MTKASKTKNPETKKPVAKERETTLSKAQPYSKTAKRDLSNHAYKAPDVTALYIHWPFCAKKCPYCDFNSHVREQIDQKRWQDALCREMETLASFFPHLTLRSIFFGGGTPSLMPAETVARLIEKAQMLWPHVQREAGDIPSLPFKPTLEISLEANPSSVEADRFKAYREAGVNRLSLGIQSLRDPALKFLGRLHDKKAAFSALEIARSVFEQISFDLIYALPDQSLNDWRIELAEALQFAPTHLSLYQLTIEEATAFYHQYQRKKFSLPDEDLALALFEETGRLTEKAGLPAYEISNHAKPGFECQHNLAYWQGLPYIGIGPGAHGRLPQTKGKALATNGIKRPEDWLKAVDAHGHGFEDIEEIPSLDRFKEALMMGLRLKKGCYLPDLEKRFLQKPDQVINFKALDYLTGEGFFIDRPDHLILSAQGWPLLNALLAEVLL